MILVKVAVADKKLMIAENRSTGKNDLVLEKVLEMFHLRSDRVFIREEDGTVSASDAC